MIGRLISNGFELDLKENVSFPFNYAISDAKEPNKRKRNFSRSVSLPGTRANMQFFSSAYQLSLSTISGTNIAGFNFDPTMRIPAKYYGPGGSLEFNGLLQLNQVKLSGGDYTFECTLFSNFIELYLALGDKKLSELGWSEYDHPLTRTVVKNSFDTSVLVNGTPTSNFTGDQPDGFGYCYGLVDYGYSRPAPKTFRTGDLYPLIYMREAFIKCLQVAGIKYSGNFVDSDLFKTCLIGFGGGDKQTLPPVETANRRTKFTGELAVSLARSSSNVVNENGTLIALFNFTSLVSLIGDSTLFPTVVTDTYSQYDQSTGIVTIEITGTYRLVITQNLISGLTTGSMTYVSGSTSYTYIVKRNGSVIAAPGIPNFQGGFPDMNVSIDLNIEATAGDTITVELFISGFLRYALPGDISTLESLYLNITDNSPSLTFDLTSTQTTLNDGDIVELGRFIPDMKASDLVTGVITMFNLLISDPDIDNVCEIEPLTDFYKPTNVFDDWTQILDYSKDVTIKPSAYIDGKSYRFKWAEDNDYDNKRYRDKFATGYGDFTFEVESTWAKGERVYQVPFAQTIPTDELTPLVVPRIVSFDESTNIKKPYKGKPRVYLLNGMKPGGWRLTNIDGSSFDDLTTYPSVHHFDNWQEPAFDLNFGLPEELQYTTGVITNNNLFVKYHREFLLDMTGKDSKLLTASFKLNSAMIENMDFGKLKMINGVLFRLNEIRDFESTNESTTECELIKIVAAKKPKTFISLPITTPVKDIPVIVSPVGAPGSSPSVPVIRGGTLDPLTTKNIILSL